MLGIPDCGAFSVAIVLLLTCLGLSNLAILAFTSKDFDRKALTPNIAVLVLACTFSAVPSIRFLDVRLCIGARVDHHLKKLVSVFLIGLGRELVISK